MESNLNLDIIGRLNKPWINLPPDILCEKSKLVFLKTILAEYHVTCHQEYPKHTTGHFDAVSSEKL